MELNDYKKKGFLPFCIEEIKLAYKARIDPKLIEKYMNDRDFDNMQLRQIRLGLEKDLDVSAYARTSMPSDEMEQIRLRLWKEQESRNLEKEEEEKLENKAFEAFVRQKNGKYRAFSKIIIKDDNRKAVKEIKNAIENITKTVSDINKTTIDVTNSLKLSNALSAFNAAAGVVNLCATVAGFAIIHAEMRKMEDGIKDVAKKMLDAHEQETFYKFDLMIDDYKDMLDCKKIDVEYSEEKYRTLISNEHVILKLLISIFTNETCNNRNDIL